MSHSDSLPALSPNREYIVIIICSARSSYKTAVKFASDSTHDIYVVSRVPSFASYLEKLIEQMTAVPNVRFVLVNSDMNILVDVLHVMLQKSTPDLTRKHKEEYLLKYKENLLKISGGMSESSPDFHVTLPPGNSDLPLGFDLAIVQDSSEIDEVNYLEEKHAFSQQALRFIALKHGARFGAVSGLESLVNDTAAMVALTNRLFQDSPGIDWFIYKPEGVSIKGDVALHQYIHIGSDSWAKIVLVARAIPHYGEMTKLLSTEVQISELNDVYEEHLRDSADRNGGVLVAEDVVEEHGNGGALKVGKASLAQYLTISGSKRQPSIKEVPSMSYREFLQSLQEEIRERGSGV